jgi:hypothetical protein
VGFHWLATPFTFDRKGIELGSYDGVEFHLFGIREDNSDGTAEEYCAVAQMRMPKGIYPEDVLSAVPKFARVGRGTLRFILTSNLHPDPDYGLILKIVP